MTLSEICIMREALHDRYRAESGKPNIVSVGQEAGYLAWLRTLSPFERVKLHREGRL